MKKLITILLVAIILLMLGSFSNKGNGVIEITSKDVVKVSINTRPGDKEIATQNVREIDDIVSYLDGLDLRNTTKDPGQHYGMSYIITLHLSNESTKEYIHFGNTFFKESGDVWYEMSYEQAEKFDGILRKLATNR